MRSRDRFRGCLIGGAAGDALGYAVEFMREKDILRKYGEHGITEYTLTDGKALISDDTQMTLFTANGLLLGMTRGMTRGVGGPDPFYIGLCYRDWLVTQESQFPPKEKPGYSWLGNLPELYSPRAPGNTCLAALHSGESGSTEKPINNSKGCGGVMRVAPIGLYFNDRSHDIKDICRFGAETAALTHGHPLGWMPAAALVQIIHEIAQDNETILDATLHALNTIDEIYPESKERDYFTNLIEKAIDLAAEDMNDIEAIHQLGEGWVAEEALAIAVYCAIKYSGDIDKALIAAVNHNGDSDSTGAVTGNIVGAQVGIFGIPEKYTENLELYDLIIEIADDLWHDCQIHEYGGYNDPVWEAKYIDISYRGNPLDVFDDRYRERLEQEITQHPFEYTDFYKQARDEFLSTKLRDYPYTKFESLLISFTVNSTKYAPLVYAMLDKVVPKVIDKNRVSITIESESEFWENFRYIEDLYNTAHSWRSFSLQYNGADFTHPTHFGYLTDFLKETHKDYPLKNERIQYLPAKKSRTRKAEEVKKVHISQDNIADVLDAVINKYVELYGKNKEVQILRVSKNEKVVVLEDYLIVYFQLTPAHKVHHEFGEYMGSPFVTIQELTYNDLFRFNFAGFRRHFESDRIALFFYKFQSFNYFSVSNPTFSRVESKLPELKLRQRLKSIPGETHHFIILRMENADGEIKYGIGETKTQVHSFILKLCKELEEKNSRSLEIYSASCLPIELNLDFIKAFLSWKGEKKRWRLENKFSYYYEDRAIKVDSESNPIKKEILRDAKAGKYDHCEFGSYIKPLNKWKSEELVYNITKEIYKDYQVIYQYKPFFLSTENGNMSYDIYICGLKTAIEYQGKQHFEPVEYFGGKENFQAQQARDKLKAEKSKENGVKLVYINYWEDITPELIRKRVEG